MNILLIYPLFPTTYWGFQYGLPIAGKQANLPPLGLITVAAILPQSWDYRLVDCNIEALTDEHLAWSDVVLTGGMRVQIEATNEILDRAIAAGKRTVVGGPAISTDLALFEQADVRIRGEVEGIAEEMAELIASSRSGITLEAEAFPDITRSPVPRFELARMEAYGSMSLQYSRGCPFHCEFCDIVKLFGQKPRVKTTAQIVAELDRLDALGSPGSIFFVDDNFIGNQKALQALLPAVTAWQEAHGHAYNFATEASVNLADRPELLEGMVQAGFNTVFLGIETPSEEALKGAGKLQNLKMGSSEAVRRISAAGIEVMGGFIVGFDTDTPAIFDAQRALILDSPIPLAMVGLLMALPQTDMWDRLKREGRLRPEGSGDHGDQFARPNFDPVMDEATLLQGYAELLAALYTAEAYYDRVENFLALSRPLPGGGRSARLGELGILLRILLEVGVRSPRRRRFWRLMSLTVRRHRQKFAWSLSRAVVGEHMIRYTEENVLPRIRENLAAMEKEREAAASEALAAAG